MSSFYNTSIDIIIPYFGHYNSVLKTIRSIFSVPNKQNIKIVLVDDCSDNVPFIDSFEKIDHVQGYRMPKHSGFGACVNYGLTKCDSPWVMVCHSDIEAKYSGWIDKMVESLVHWKEKDNSVKMISASCDFPGDDIDKRLKSSEPTDAKEFTLNTHSPFYATMFHRELPEHIGGYLFEELSLIHI